MGFFRVDAAIDPNRNPVTVTDDYAMGAAQDVNVDCSSKAITVTLPGVTATKGQYCIIRKIDSADNAVTISGTVDGETKVLYVRYQWIKISSNGSVWYSGG